MKVLMIAKERADEWVQGQYSLAEQFNAAGLTSNATRANHEANGLANIRAAMTTIDIPDGCVLAVVDPSWQFGARDPIWPNEMLSMVRVIQEVKLP